MLNYDWKLIVYISFVNVMNGVTIMRVTEKNKQQENLYRQNDLIGMLDRGIDDMELRRELPIDEAFQKISEQRDSRRNARV